MLKLSVRLCLAITIVSADFVECMPQTNEPPKKSAADVMREIRLKVLTTRPSQTGRSSTAEYPHVDTMLMDWPVEEGIVSLMASSVGDASIYTTGSFGVMGGVQFESVRALAQNFVKLGERYYSEAIPTKEHSFPQSGCVRFYLICYDEVRIIEGEATSLASGKDKLSDLFIHAQRVISELRQIVERQKAKRDDTR